MSINSTNRDNIISSKHRPPPWPPAQDSVQHGVRETSKVSGRGPAKSESAPGGSASASANASDTVERWTRQPNLFTEGGQGGGPATEAIFGSKPNRSMGHSDDPRVIFLKRLQDQLPIKRDSAGKDINAARRRAAVELFFKELKREFEAGKITKEAWHEIRGAAKKAKNGVLGVSGERILKGLALGGACLKTNTLICKCMDDPLGCYKAFKDTGI